MSSCYADTFSINICFVALVLHNTSEKERTEKSWAYICDFLCWAYLKTKETVVITVGVDKDRITTVKDLES